VLFRHKSDADLFFKTATQDDSKETSDTPTTTTASQSKPSQPLAHDPSSTHCIYHESNVVDHDDDQESNVNQQQPQFQQLPSPQRKKFQYFYYFMLIHTLVVYQQQQQWHSPSLWQQWSQPINSLHLLRYLPDAPLYIYTNGISHPPQPANSKQ
jgi:hypothetical protein